MSFQLIAVDRGINLGELASRERKFLKESLTTSGKHPTWYVDPGGIAALEATAREEYEKWFAREVKSRCEDADEAELRDKVNEKFEVLPEDFRKAKLQAVLRPAIQASLKRMNDQLRELLLDAVFTADDEALDELDFDTRQKAIDQVLGVAPEPYTPEELVTYDYSQTALAFASSVMAGRIEQTQHIPIALEEDPDEAAARDAALRVTDGLLRALLMSADEHQFRAMLVYALNTGWHAHMHRLFDDELDSDLESGAANPAFLEDVRALVDRHGSVELALLDGKPEIAISVEVMEGRELPVRDMVSSDPYCVLSVVDSRIATSQKGETNIVYSSLTPRWEESFHFVLTNRGEVRVEMFDRDRFSADDPMGTVVIKPEELDEGETWDHWHALEYVSNGELRLKLTLRTLEDWEESNDPAEDASD